jgi:hypothetical protein
MDLALDLLAILGWVGIPLAVALMGLMGGIRASSLPGRAIGGAVALAGTWLAIVAAVSFVRCPAQDETCGTDGLIGDLGTYIGLVTVIAGFLVLVGRWKRGRLQAGR